MEHPRPQLAQQRAGAHTVRQLLQLKPYANWYAWIACTFLHGCPGPSGNEPGSSCGKVRASEPLRSWAPGVSWCRADDQLLLTPTRPQLYNLICLATLNWCTWVNESPMMPSLPTRQGCSSFVLVLVRYFFNWPLYHAEDYSSIAPQTDSCTCN